MSENAPKTNWLKDYQPPAYFIESIDLEFDLFEDHAIVTSQMECRSNPEKADSLNYFECFGEELELVTVLLNGNPIPENPLQSKLQFCHQLLFSAYNLIFMMVAKGKEF